VSQATALVPAAGFGTRFHEGGPKALVLLAGKPLLVHALERLAASKRVSSAVVAIPGGCEAAFHAALKSSPLPYVLVEGGVTRRESVARAFAAADPEDGDAIVLVHDAARPLVDPLEVKAVVDAADATGAAIAAFSLVETIKRVEAGKIKATVPRGDLVAATTPQAFRAAILRKGLAKEGGPDATDDAELVERAGGEVTVVLTSRWNIKITYPEDLAWAEAWLAQVGRAGA
jgi:2-C-methyl-D-erythritol 4-phosphate cytidylyltransferase